MSTFTPRTKYNHGSKHDVSYGKAVKAVCIHCLEKSTFRVVQIETKKDDGSGHKKSQMVNHVACTRCLKSMKHNKRMKIIQHPIIKVTHFTTQEKIQRQWYRIKRWFIGDHIYKSFGRKRKK